MEGRAFKLSLMSIAIALLAGCDRSPDVKIENWGLERKGSDYTFSLQVRPIVPPRNGIQGVLKLFYSDGCRGERTFAIDDFGPESGVTQPSVSGGPMTFTRDFTIPTQVAGAQLQLEHKTGTERGNIAFFDQAKVIDPVAQKKAETAKCKPAAPVRNALPQPSQETAAAIINLRGYLCGRVTDIYPRGQSALIVHCTEYRDGRGKAQYLVRTDNAAVERLD